MNITLADDGVVPKAIIINRTLVGRWVAHGL
jgi:hypothetical protein